MSTRARAGKKARDAGKSFEDFFVDLCSLNKVRAVRIPDAGRTVRTKYGIQFKRAKSPFDFFITKDGLSACLDTKTTQNKTFSHSKIDQSQVKWLDFTGGSIPSGYVIWFQILDSVVFYNHEILKNLQPGSGLKPEDGLHLGTLAKMKPEMILNAKP